MKSRIATLVLLAASAFFCPMMLAQQSATQSLSNDTVVKLVKAGLSDDLIISINALPGVYDTSPDGLIALKGAHVSDPVIAAILLKPSSTASTPKAPPLKARPLPLLRRTSSLLVRIDLLFRPPRQLRRNYLLRYHRFQNRPPGTADTVSRGSSDAVSRLPRGDTDRPEPHSGDASSHGRCAEGVPAICEQGQEPQRRSGPVNGNEQRLRKELPRRTNYDYSSGGRLYRTSQPHRNWLSPGQPDTGRQQGR